MDRRITQILILIYILTTLVIITACTPVSTQESTDGNEPTATPIVEPSPTVEPASIADSRLDGYETIPVLKVRYASRNSKSHWLSESITVLTDYQELSKLIEDKNELTQSYKDELKEIYNDEYFIGKAIMVVQFEHTSGSDRVHDFLGIVIEDNKLCPVIEHGYKGLGTANLSYTIIFVELDNEYATVEPGKILTINKYNDEYDSFKPKNVQ